ncbi:MAG: Ger(x)C family spore germination C-terminal domain-containing protein, partial [Firmicutes bacterium]|nr:Ger(x)C family spore germination C-terminal domain-containing protein [Bacillota bacterium]
VTLRGGKTENDLTAVTNATKAQLERETYEFIKRVQTDYESDIFGFANALNARSPKDYKKISENFNEYFKRAEVKIDYRCAVDKTERLLG